MHKLNFAEHKGVNFVTKVQEKEALCQKFQELLYIILRYGNGAILLSQLRALCAVLFDMSGQATNRAVRALKNAGILSRQTWVDNNSDLILARKYVYRYFYDKTSQEAATPRRPNTMAPYLLQARKIEWLLSIIRDTITLEELENHFFNAGCTVFLRLPDLIEYYQEQAPILSNVRPDNYQDQLWQLEVSNQQRRDMARRDPSNTFPPIITLEQMHKRGVYITNIIPEKKRIYLAVFAGRETKARRLMDWLIDAHFWVLSLLPDYDTALYVYALDSGHREALLSALQATAPGTQATPYWAYRLEGQKIFGRAFIGVKDSDFLQKWCGNVSALSTI